MNKKTLLFCILNSFAPILLGVLIYYFVREDTPLHSFLPSPLPVEMKSFAAVRLISFYVADALWGYALFYAVLPFNGIKTAFCISLCCGVIWELLQKFKIVNGTFDYWDIFSYLIASTVAITIYKLWRRKQ